MKKSLFFISSLLFLLHNPYLANANKPSKNKIVKRSPLKKANKIKLSFVSSLRKIPVDMRKIESESNSKLFYLQHNKGSENVKPSDIYPFVSANILYGINLKDGTSVWKKIINENSFVYGIEYPDDKYVFFIVQDEVSRSGKFVVLDRLTGSEVNAFQFWGDLGYFHDYQRKFLTVKGIDGAYYTFLVMRKGRGHSRIMKISFYPDKSTFSDKTYMLDSVITSPLSSQQLLQSEWSFKKEVWEYVKVWNIFWAEKNIKTGNNFIGSLSRTSDRINRFSLIDDGDILNRNYNVRNPVALFQSASNLYLFVSMNRIFFKNDTQKGVDYNSKLKTSNLVGIYKIPPPYKKMELSPYKYTPIDGHILFSPGVFKEHGTLELFYLYYFSALPVEEGKGGIKNILTLFEPMFWNGQIYVGPQSFSFGDEEKEEEGYQSNYLGIPSIYRMGADKKKQLKVMFIPSNDIDVFSYRKGKKRKDKAWLREYSYNEKVKGSSGAFLGVSNKPVQKINDLYIVSSNFKGKNRIYAFLMSDSKSEFPYSLEPAWTFEGGDFISSPVSLDQRTGMLMSVSKRTLTMVPEANFYVDSDAVVSKYTPVKVPRNLHPENSSDVSSPVVRYKDYIYWVSDGVMFRKKGVNAQDLEKGAPEKFVELGKNISTGIGFGNENFSFGTNGDGVKVYTLDRVNYYSFFVPDGRVSSKPVFKGNRVYFTTEERNKSFFYSMAMDKENFFLLPNYLWNPDKLDKNFSESTCYRFETPRIISTPVMGKLNGQSVWFVGTTTGKIFAIPMSGDIKVDKKGEIDQTLLPWVGQLAGADEGIKLPLAYDEKNQLLFAVSDRGWVSVFDLSSLKTSPAYRWPFMQTNDSGVSEASGFSVSNASLALNVVGKNFNSVFYSWNYFSKKYLRVPVAGHLVFSPLLVGSRAYVTTRNGKVISFDVSGVKP